MASSITEVIEKILLRYSIHNGFKKAWIEKNWVAIVGEEAGKHSIPYKVEGDVLFVSVDSSVWNQELFMKKKTITKKVNHLFSSELIKNITYRIEH